MIHSLESSRTIFWAPDAWIEHRCSLPARDRRRSNLMSILLALFGFLLQTPAPAAPPQPAPGNPVVVIETSAGTITAELFKDRAPVSVENFLQYARDGHYDGTIWHRVVSGYVIQGGGYTPGAGREGHPAPHPERGHQRPEQPARHARHGPHAARRAARRRSSTSTSSTTRASITAASRPTTSATPSSAACSTGMDVVDKIGAVKVGVARRHGHRAGHARS